MNKPLSLKPQFYATIFEDLVLIAKGFHYNLVLHGSLNRDLDLIAIPWSDDFYDPKDMVQAMAARLGGTLVSPKANILPGGRLSFVINLYRSDGNHVDQQYYLDISVTMNIGHLLSMVNGDAKLLRTVIDDFMMKQLACTE